MKRKEFVQNLNSVCRDLERLELDSGVLINTALHGYMSSALSCINSALHHTNEYKSF